MVRSKLAIAREYHIQPSEIDRLVYFEFEWWVEEINKTAKNEAKQREEDERQQQSQFKMPSMSQMQNSFKMPSMPSMPKF